MSDEPTGLLFVISGPGGVGKDTVIEKLLQANPNLHYSVSFTTRPKRDYEVDGKHYTFVDEEQFRKLLARNELLEHATINGFLYGTSRTRVEKAQRRGLDVILKIDVQGAETVRKERPDAIFIFIQPPSMDELMKRRRQRGAEPPEVMRERQKLAEWEMSLAPFYDYVVVNENADQAARDIAAIIEAEKRRRKVQPEQAP